MTPHTTFCFPPSGTDPQPSYQRATVSPLSFYVNYWALCVGLLFSLHCSVPALSISLNHTSSQRLPSSSSNLSHSQFIQHWHFLNCTVQTHHSGTLLKGWFFTKSEVGLSVCTFPTPRRRRCSCCCSTAHPPGAPSPLGAALK